MGYPDLVPASCFAEPRATARTGVPGPAETGLVDVVDIDELQQTVRRAPSCEYSDLYWERSVRLNARYAGGRVTELISARTAGTSLRTVADGAAHYDALDVPAARCRADTSSIEVPEQGGRLLTVLASVDEAARSLDSRIHQVLIDAELAVQDVAVVTPKRVLTDRRHLLYLTIRVVAEHRGTVATGFLTPGTSAGGLGLDGAAAGRAAGERALVALAGRPAPVAHLPVVVGPGRGTVLIHEACCHPLEADEVQRGSIYADRIGSLVARPGLSIIDDPGVAGAVGSYRVDDDGAAASATTLVEDGRLRSFLTDLMAVRQLGMPGTGNGRREGFRNPPQPRMSNTCVAPGPHDPSEVIADVRRGLYAQHVGGGEVVESTGEFVFRVVNGFLIENGRITDPVRETTVRGNGVDVLNGIDAVGSDVRVGVARCGKFGQTVPVGVCGPTLRIRSLLVGGTVA